MKATQHTPAPWSIEWDHKSNIPEFIRAFVDGEMEDIAIISPDTPLANARLISTAPDLLIALESLLSDKSCPRYLTLDEWHKTHPEFRETLRKAKGEA